MQYENSHITEATADGGRYTWPFQVRHYELDPLGVARPEVYLNWMQEAGILASANAGYPLERYASMGAFWWVHRFRIEWYGDVEYLDAVEATTWISSFRRIRALREYEIRRRDDQRLICSSQADWALVNTATGRPTRVPVEMLTSFPPSGVEALGTLPWTWDTAPSRNSPFTSRRAVQYHELDTMGHVNHAVYLVWFLDNLRQSDSVLGRGVDIKPERFDLEYLHSARQGDSLLVACWLMEQHDSVGCWGHEIRLQDNETIVARAHSVCRLVSLSDGL